MTHEMPAPRMAMGAISREEPQPKFEPPTTMSPGATRCDQPSFSGTPSIACSPSFFSSREKIAYLAGMIWSVSTLSPNLQARPRSMVVIGPPRAGASSKRGQAPPSGIPPFVRYVGGASGAALRVRARPWCATRRTHSLGRSPLLRPMPSSPDHLARVRDLAGHGAGRGHGRVGQVDEGLRVAHPAREVAVRGREAHFALAQDAHVAAQAGAARGR